MAAAPEASEPDDAASAESPAAAEGAASAESPAAAEGADQVPETLHGAPVTYSHGQRVVHPSRDQYVELVTALRSDGYFMLYDLTAVDYLTHPGRPLPEGVEPGRFEVVAGVMNHRNADRVRVRVQVPAEDPWVPTLMHLHPGADALEREAFDMFGVRFEGHLDPTRILMPEDWVGHPLRKDYESGRIPVQFKGDRAEPVAIRPGPPVGRTRGQAR